MLPLKYDNMNIATSPDQGNEAHYKQTGTFPDTGSTVQPIINQIFVNCGPNEGASQGEISKTGSDSLKKLPGVSTYDPMVIDSPRKSIIKVPSFPTIARKLASASSTETRPSITSKKDKKDLKQPTKPKDSFAVPQTFKSLSSFEPVQSFRPQELSTPAKRTYIFDSPQDISSAPTELTPSLQEDISITPDIEMNEDNLSDKDPGLDDLQRRYDKLVAQVSLPMENENSEFYEIPGDSSGIFKDGTVEDKTVEHAIVSTRLFDQEVLIEKLLKASEETNAKLNELANKTESDVSIEEKEAIKVEMNKLMETNKEATYRLSMLETYARELENGKEFLENDIKNLTGNRATAEHTIAELNKLLANSAQNLSNEQYNATTTDQANENLRREKANDKANLKRMKNERDKLLKESSENEKEALAAYKKAIHDESILKQQLDEAQNTNTSKTNEIEKLRMSNQLSNTDAQTALDSMNIQNENLKKQFKIETAEIEKRYNEVTAQKSSLEEKLALSNQENTIKIENLEQTIINSQRGSGNLIAKITEANQKYTTLNNITAERLRSQQAEVTNALQDTSNSKKETARLRREKKDLEKRQDELKKTGRAITEERNKSVNELKNQISSLEEENKSASQSKEDKERNEELMKEKKEKATAIGRIEAPSSSTTPDEPTSEPTSEPTREKRKKEEEEEETTGEKRGKRESTPLKKEKRKRGINGNEETPKKQKQTPNILDPNLPDSRDTEKDTAYRKIEHVINPESARFGEPYKEKEVKAFEALGITPEQRKGLNENELSNLIRKATLTKYRIHHPDSSRISPHLKWLAKRNFQHIQRAKLILDEGDLSLPTKRKEKEEKQRRDDEELREHTYDSPFKVPVDSPFYVPPSSEPEKRFNTAKWRTHPSPSVETVFEARNDPNLATPTPKIPLQQELPSFSQETTKSPEAIIEPQQELPSLSQETIMEDVDTEPSGGSINSKNYIDIPKIRIKPKEHDKLMKGILKFIKSSREKSTRAKSTRTKST